MKQRIAAAVAVVVLAATVGLTAAAPAGAWTPAHMPTRPSRPGVTELSVVHGIPNLPVDIYLVKDFFSVRKLSSVNFGTAADLDTALPGFVTPGLYFVDVVPAGASPFHPVLDTWVLLGRNQSKTIVAYVTADPAGHPGSPALKVFTNDVSSTGGQARVTTTHTAVAPTVGVYADGAVGIPAAFSNGQRASAVVPAGTYGVSITAPNDPTGVLASLGNVNLAANTNTLAFAIGTFPTTFRVVTLQIPTA